MICTAQKMKFSIKDLFSKCEEDLLEKSLMEDFIFCVVLYTSVVDIRGVSISVKRIKSNIPLI